LLTVDNKNSDSNLDEGETITIVFSEAVDVDSLVLGSQFSPIVLTRADEAKLGTGYSVAASSSGTATTFVITLGADNSTTDLDLLVSSNASVRTLTFNKASILDASGNTAASHIALVLPTDIAQANASAITHITANTASNGAYAAGEVIQLVFTEAVNESLAVGDLQVVAGKSLGSGATLAATGASGGFATTFVLTLGSSPVVAANDKINIAVAKVVDQQGSLGFDTDNNAANGSFVTFSLPATTKLQLTNSTLDLTGVTLNGAVNVIDLNGKAATLNFAQFSLPLTNSDGPVSGITVKDESLNASQVATLGADAKVAAIRVSAVTVNKTQYEASKAKLHAMIRSRLAMTR
jgi:hypothetical protein